MQSENNSNDYKGSKDLLVFLTCNDGSQGINWLPPENRSSAEEQEGLGLLRLFRKGLGDGETDEEVVLERVRERKFWKRKQGNISGKGGISS